jgi:hypothetical protein
VASRVCPLCNAKVRAGAVAAFSGGVDCPGCHARLEVNPAARKLAAWAGLAAGWLAWRTTRGGPGILGSVLPLFYALLAFGVISALVVILAGDLRPAPELSPVESVPPTGHRGAAHGGGHH